MFKNHTARRLAFIWMCIPLAMTSTAASAQLRDGPYTGTLECGPLLTDPQKGSWSQPVKLQVTGKTVLWERSDPRITESGTGMLQGGRVSFTLDGKWNPGQRNTGRWRNVAMLNWNGSQLSGAATIFSADGLQRLRDCSVRVAADAAPAVATTASARTASPDTPVTGKPFPRDAGPLLSAAVTQKLGGVAESALNKVPRSPVAAAPTTMAEPASASALTPSDKAQLDYETERAKQDAAVASRENRALVPITPDMCVDGVCVEQDLGALAVNLNWTPPAKSDPIPNSHRKAYEDAVRKGMQVCEQSNQALWGDKTRKLCDFLILSNERPKADLVAFFKENKQPVCEPGGKLFKLSLETTLGHVRFEVRFSKDGRPKVAEIVKEFNVQNKTDLAELRTQMRKKHPYIGNSVSSKSAPWGGYVGYDDGMYGEGPRYQIDARSIIFAAVREGPNEGACTPARKTISVQ